MKDVLGWTTLKETAREEVRDSFDPSGRQVRKMAGQRGGTSGEEEGDRAMGRRRKRVGVYRHVTVERSEKERRQVGV